MFEREVHVRARPIGQPGAPDVGADADDLSCVLPMAHAHADGILAAEELPLDRGADDHNRRPIRAVAPIEQPTSIR